MTHNLVKQHPLQQSFHVMYRSEPGQECCQGLGFLASTNGLTKTHIRHLPLPPFWSRCHVSLHVEPAFSAKSTIHSSRDPGWSPLICTVNLNQTGTRKFEAHKSLMAQQTSSALNQHLSPGKHCYRTIAFPRKSVLLLLFCQLVHDLSVPFSSTKLKTGLETQAVYVRNMKHKDMSRGTLWQ